MLLIARVLAVIALVGATMSAGVSPAAAQSTPSVVANGPWIAGANSAVVQGTPSPALAVSRIEQVSGGLEVSALWFLGGGGWQYYLPEFPDISTLTQLPSPAAIIVILVQGSGGPSLGSISGPLTYPSEAIPPLRVVAIEVDTGKALYVDTVLDQTTYTIPNVPAGRYHVIAYRPGTNFAGGYTRAVPCGLHAGCADHTLLPVVVDAGQHVTGISPADWRPLGFFPPDPTR